MDPVFAVSVAGTIEKIGAYAGFAAIPGLAVLALLYFAQAREVRRLREWAGRAPERAQELHSRVAEQAAHASGRRVSGQPLAGRPGTAAGRAGGSGQPPPGRSQPPRPSRATPSAQAVEPAPPGGSSGSPPPGATGPQEPPAGGASRAAAEPARAAATAAGVGRTLDPGATAGSDEPSPAASEAGRGSSVGTRPAAEPSAADNDHRPEGSSGPEMRPAAGSGAAAAPLRTTRRTATLPRNQAGEGAYTARRLPAEPSDQSTGGRRRGVAVAAGIAVVAAVGLAVVVVSGTAGGGSRPAGKVARVGSATGAPPSGGPVVRNRTTVAVLNGTTVPGLAAQVAADLERGGFKRGSVTNAADQQRPSTTVDYAPGYQRAAREVGAMLKVRQVAPIDAGTQAIAGPQAGVVVTVGSDRLP